MMRIMMMVTGVCCSAHSLHPHPPPSTNDKPTVVIHSLPKVRRRRCRRRRPRTITSSRRRSTSSSSQPPQRHVCLGQPHQGVGVVAADGQGALVPLVRRRPRRRGRRLQLLRSHLRLLLITLLTPLLLARRKG
jgi:hypothetical protein